MAQAFVGTSGWSYADWKEDFYGGRPAKRWLGFLAQRFPTVEINNTFYAMPRPTTVAKWSRQVPPGFRFAVKLWRGVTHYRSWEDPDVPRILADYLAAVGEFQPAQRAPLLVQLPPQAHADARRLGVLLARIDDAGQDGGAWRVAVEFRHPSWLEDAATARVLADYEAALCVHDMQRRGAVTQPNEAPFVYVRRHGPKSRYQGSYAPSQIAADAKEAEAWVAQGRDVFVYYNNDHGGNAHRNAASLQEALARRKVPLPMGYLRQRTLDAAFPVRQDGEPGSQAGGRRGKALPPAGKR